MTWIRFNRVDDSENAIYLPYKLANQLSSLLNFEFGINKVKLQVKSIQLNYIESENCFDNPLTIDCSSQVLDELLINDSITYQIKFFENSIKVGPVIGLLLGEQYYYYHGRYLKELTESMAIYPQVGGLYFTFKPSSIDWENKCIYGLYYNNSLNSWLYGKFPLPSVVFLRGFQSKSETINKLKVITENKVFNSARFNKWEIYEKLTEYNVLTKYLPETKRLQSIKDFKDFTQKYTDIVLKPASLSRGRGIYFIKKLDNRTFLLSGNDYRTSQEVKNLEISKSNLYNFLLDGLFLKRNYIMQPKLQLAKVNGGPFDVRVVMQKNEYEKWQCSGIECRIAGFEDILTNISRGGQALPIDKTIQLAFGNDADPALMREEIINIGLEYCNFADQLGERFAEFGLDIAIDINKRYWFIEANVRPTFKGFKKMDYKNYIDICCMPLLYAASIAGFRRKV